MSVCLSRDCADNIVASNVYALVAVSKGMWAVKLCSNKNLQFLTGGAG